MTISEKTEDCESELMDKCLLARCYRDAGAKSRYPKNLLSDTVIFT